MLDYNEMLVVGAAGAVALRGLLAQLQTLHWP